MKMFGFDTLDWRQVKIDWDAITDDIIKAGTPMDKDGHICNDGNVFGILMDDVQRKRNVQGRVVISGCMDMKVAEEHSGITLSAEAKAALPDIWTHSGGGGVTDYNKLENRPVSAEKGETVILPEITVEIEPEYGEGIFSNVADVKVGNLYIVTWNGTEYYCEAVLSNAANPPMICLGNIAAANGETPTAEPFMLSFLDAETAASAGFGGGVLSLDGSTSVTLSVNDAIVHPLANMYLPKMVVNFTKVDDDDVNNAVSDKKYNEVLAAFQKGYELEGRFVNTADGITYHYVAPLTLVSVREDGFGQVYFCAFVANNVIMMLIEEHQEVLGEEKNAHIKYLT